MYMTKKVIENKLSLSVPQVSLPRRGVIVEIILDTMIKIKNSGSNDATLKLADILKNIDFRVVSDGNKIHYALNGEDIAIMNYYDSKKAENPDETITVKAGNEVVIEPLLRLNLGEIHALLHSDLFVGWNVRTGLATNVTIEDAKAVIAVREKIFESEDEYVEVYGENGEGIAEVKAYAMEADFDASSEYAKVLALPVGTLLWRGVLIAKDTNGVRSDDVIEKYGLFITRPQTLELYNITWGMAKKLDRLGYGVIPVTGVAIFDYEEELGSMINGALYDKGDIAIYAVTKAKGKLRYISNEFVVGLGE